MRHIDINEKEIKKKNNKEKVEHISDDADSKDVK
jgi:hypothetical protein